MNKRYLLYGLLIGIIVGILLLIVAYSINNGDASYPFFSLQTLMYAVPTWVVWPAIIGLVIGWIYGLVKNRL